MTTTTLYRFRSIKSLLNNKELGIQALYLNKARQPNAPLKKYRNFVWQGDAIVWANLFRHYLFTVVKTEIYAALEKKDFTFKNINIPIWIMPKDGDAFNTKEDSQKFETLYQLISSHLHLEEVLYHLDAKKCSKKEVLRYLQFLHLPIVLITQEFIQAENEELRDELIQACEATAKILVTLITAENHDQQILDSYLYERSTLLINLLHQNSESDLSYDTKLLLSDFPALYLEKLYEMVKPPATSSLFIASFTRDYQQKKLWENYAEQHTGVCLIFDLEENEMQLSPQKRVFEKTSAKNKRHSNKKSKRKNVDAQIAEHFDPSSFVYQSYPLQNVTYTEYPLPERNFFKSQAGASWKTIYSWHRDNEKNLSQFGKFLLGNETKWLKEFWEGYYEDLLIKSIDYQGEQENCLIIEENTPKAEKPEENSTTVYHYKPKQLRGIIFGINTTDTDIRKTIDIIKNGNFREDFKFYQADYCHETGKIQKRLLPI